MKFVNIGALAATASKVSVTYNPAAATSAATFTIVDSADGHAVTFGSGIDGEGSANNGGVVFPDGSNLLISAQGSSSVMPPAPPTPPLGLVLKAADGGSNLAGTTGSDTLIGAYGADTLTGGAGADTFTFNDVPWKPGHITDFTVGVDKLDLGGFFAKVGYTGSDPVADGYVKLVNGNLGDTWVILDRDGNATGDRWGTYAFSLDHLDGGGESLGFSKLTWANLQGGAGATAPGNPPPSPPPPVSGGAGLVLAAGFGPNTLTGGLGNDTINASRLSDVLIGGGGSDHFVIGLEPWSPALITDFAPGIDKIDLRGMLASAGYDGRDPFADGHLKLASDGAGGTQVLFDRDGAGPDPQWPNYVLHIANVAPAAMGSGDWIFH